MGQIFRKKSEKNQNIGMHECERPNVTIGTTERFKTGCGSLYIHVNHDERGLIEVFLNLRGGGCPAQSEAIARLVSLCLRGGVEPLEVVQQLQGIRCPSVYYAKSKGEPMDALSCPDAVARAISKSIDAGESSKCERKMLDEIPDADMRTELEEVQLEIW